MMLTVEGLYRLMHTALEAGHGSRPIVAQGFNESGDYVDLPLKGDIRIDQDSVGNLILVIR